MGRLIDADDVMEMLTNIELSCTVIPITEAKLRLRDIPTAYDIDKVVEEFEKIRAKEKCNKEKCPYCGKKIIGRNANTNKDNSKGREKD